MMIIQAYKKPTKLKANPTFLRKYPLVDWRTSLSFSVDVLAASISLPILNRRMAIERRDSRFCANPVVHIWIADKAVHIINNATLTKGMVFNNAGLVIPVLRGDAVYR